jgi:hypothetical protein
MTARTRVEIQTRPDGQWWEPGFAEGVCAVIAAAEARVPMVDTRYLVMMRRAAARLIAAIDRHHARTARPS